MKGDTRVEESVLAEILKQPIEPPQAVRCRLAPNGCRVLHPLRCFRLELGNVNRFPGIPLLTTSLPFVAETNEAVRFRPSCRTLGPQLGIDDWQSLGGPYLRGGRWASLKTEIFGVKAAVRRKARASTQNIDG